MKKKLLSVFALMLMLIFVVVSGYTYGRRDFNYNLHHVSSINQMVVEPVFLAYRQYLMYAEEDTYIERKPEWFEIEVQEKMKEIESITNKKEWFLAYKAIVDEYDEYLDPPETVYDYFNDDDIYLMQRCIETEAYDADFESKTNIASVIINRWESEEFPATIPEIIVPGQVSFWRTNITEDTVLALEYAFQIEDTTTGALYFETTYIHEAYAQPLFTDNIGHRFYQ